jgi:hypothetical protein
LTNGFSFLSSSQGSSLTAASRTATAKVNKREPRRVEKRSYTDIEQSVAEIIADTKLKAGPIIRAVGFISYTCDDMLNGLRLKRRRVADAKEAADQKKQDAKAKLEEKAKAILTGDDTFEKWSKDKLLTVLKYKEVPGVAHQMDKDALRTAYENTLPLAERRDDTLPLAERETQQAANPIP